METEQVYVKNDGTGMERALKTADWVARDAALGRKEALHFRLLVEETLGMVSAMAGEFQAVFWIEYEKKDFKIRLEAKTQMHFEKREELLSVSRGGKNYANKGIMGKIRGLFETAISDYKEVRQMQSENGIMGLSYGAMGVDATNAMSQSVMTWSLEQYRQSVQQENGGAQEEEYDEYLNELERSIVANIADEIQVGIRMDTVDMTIFKNFG